MREILGVFEVFLGIFENFKSKEKKDRVFWVFPDFSGLSWFLGCDRGGLGKGSRPAKRGKVARKWCTNSSEPLGQESGRKSFALVQTLFCTGATLFRTNARDFFLTLAPEAQKTFCTTSWRLCPF